MFSVQFLRRTAGHPYVLNCASGWRVAGHTALILGAGFSKPAGGPLLRELLSAEMIGRSDADEDVLAALSDMLEARRAVPNQEGTTIEELFTEVWREARTAGNLRVGDSAWPAAELLSGLTTHLASVCGALHVRRSGGLWKMYVGFLGKLWKECRSLEVITFNYDLLLEQLLDDVGLRFSYGAADGIAFDDNRRRARMHRSGHHLELLKLHGSSNWGICRGCRKAGRYLDQVTAFEKPYVPLRRRTCPWCRDKFLETGIIPPILGKAGESRHMGPVWLQARRALRRAREIIVIGYSLPPSDAEAVSLFREIEGLLKRPRITVVCGSKGAPPSYGQVFSGFTDAKKRFEGFAEDFVSAD